MIRGGRATVFTMGRWTVVMARWESQSLRQSSLQLKQLDSRYPIESRTGCKPLTEICLFVYPSAAVPLCVLAAAAELLGLGLTLAVAMA